MSTNFYNLAHLLIYLFIRPSMLNSQINPFYPYHFHQMQIIFCDSKLYELISSYLAEKVLLILKLYDLQ